MLVRGMGDFLSLERILQWADVLCLLTAVAVILCLYLIRFYILVNGEQFDSQFEPVLFL